MSIYKKKKTKLDFSSIWLLFLHTVLHHIEGLQLDIRTHLKLEKLGPAARVPATYLVEVLTKTEAFRRRRNLEPKSYF